MQPLIIVPLAKLIIAPPDSSDSLESKIQFSNKIGTVCDATYTAPPAFLEVLPLNDSSAIKALSHHIDLFSDYSPDDIVTFNKSQNNEELTSEEQALVDKMTRDIEDKASENRIITTNEFLASQTRIKGSDADYPTRLKFWQRFNFAAKFAISFRVEEMLGLDEDVTNRLFRDDG